MKKTLLIGTAVALTMSVSDVIPANAAFAQEDDEARQATIIITGTRRQERSAADSPAPVDVIGGLELINQGDSDMSNLLRTSVPSYNVNTQPISDAATIIRPANLRGLSPDNTLILLNGKRRHRAAVISFLGGGISDGAQGADVSAIPAIALKQVEVLRDGAASQYGSDAIAGVINFILKDDAEGGSVEAKWGSTYDGDGDQYQIAGNIGLPIGPNGFLNLSAEYQETDATNRSVQRDDARRLILAGNSAVGNPAQVWGQPELSGDYKIFANFGIDLNEATEFYAFGNYAERETEGGFFFRNPTNRGGVFSLDGGTTLAVGDLADRGPGACATVNFLDTDGDGNLDTPDPVALALVNADPDCFSFLELFPGGFTPSFGGELTDTAINVGLRGEFDMGTGLFYDVSYSYGQSEITFFINNTINASLGPNTPTSFTPGGYTQTETGVNVDLSYGLPVAAFASDLNIAGGFQYREEEFDIAAGDAASFQIGPLSAPTANYPTGQGFSSSSNGFGGFTTASAGASTEASTAFYIDLEADVTEKLTLQGAVRNESFDNFDSTTDYKIGGLFRVNDAFSIRSTFQTGFHVPTAGQANVVNVTTAFSGTQLVDQGTIPLLSPAGQFMADFIETHPGFFPGVTERPTLGVEESESFSLGAAWNWGDVDFTVDYFNIDVSDRIAISSQFSFFNALTQVATDEGVAILPTDSTSQILNALGTAGVLNVADFAGSEDLTSFGFFNNDFDTSTQGLDFVITSPLELTDGGNSNLAFVMNFTDTSVESIGTLTPGRLRQLEDNLPAWKGNVTLTHQEGPWRGLARANYYGSFFEDHLDANLAFPIEGSARITFDFEAGRMLGEQFEIIVGARNAFDQFPEENPFAGVVGAKYALTAPGGFNGGSYYLKGRLTF